MKNNNDSAVSPVIGVILMVAITVILAAVIAAFVFGMAGNVGKTYSIGVTAQKTSSTVGYVVFQGGKDAAEVAGIRVGINDDTTSRAMGNIAEPLGDQPLTVGSSVSIPLDGITYPRPSGARKDHILVTAVFLDGSEQLILDTNL